jgi:hypothetical protein
MNSSVKRLCALYKGVSGVKKETKGGYKMAEQADVYVKNNLADSINVIRKLQDGTSDLDIPIANGAVKKVLLAGPEVWLIIKAPGGSTQGYRVVVRSGIIDLAVSSSTDRWRMRIIPNDLPPEVPTTVNVDVGEDEPEP